MRLVQAIVVAVSDVGDTQRLTLEIDERIPSAPAICYPALTGRCSVGDRVVVNTTAVDLGLGTGGAHFVVARGAPGEVHEVASGGHIMKLRYTPLQHDVLAVEEPASPAHDALIAPEDLGGTPVVCCGLHSQVLPVAAAVKERRPDARLAYVMTDEAALPIALSRVAAEMSAAGLIDVTYTCGQAFGGEVEAVTLHSALIAAKVVSGADVIVVSIGPGNVGTTTTFGHTGIAQAEAVNAVAALAGTPVAVLRVSFADARPEHHGLSHHSLTALGRIALAAAEVPVPALSEPHAALLEDALRTGAIFDRHRRHDVPVPRLPDTRGIEMRSMGRSPDDDPAFFQAAAAAGHLAADLLG
ncbi:MAG: DUF3866 family protein [Coriobacteriia bacterium]